MTEKTEKNKEDNAPARKKLSLSGGTLSLGGGSSAPKNDSATGSSTVEVKKKRGAAGRSGAGANKTMQLTDEEREARIKALKLAQSAPRAAVIPTVTPKSVYRAIEPKKVEPVVEEAVKKPLDKDSLREQEMAQMKSIEADELAKKDAVKKKRDEEAKNHRQTESAQMQVPDANVDSRFPNKKFKTADKTADNNDKNNKTPAKKTSFERRNSGKLTVTQVLNKDHERGRRGPSLAAQKRAREKERMQAKGPIETVKQYKEVIIPEAITVQELANRMTERVGDVVKKMMEMGVMATANQTIDADTAELITTELGHTVKRVSENDIEIDLLGIQDNEEDLVERPPVVTVMGHVDHGKTSLLDAIRAEDVASGEAGGITQHIGAYQIELKSGNKITFLDTPGHAAFSEMRARGADVTDIVVLVVAADDSVMPQTIEAINHAKAAKKPIIIAINKCDLENANPDKVRGELLQHEIVVESMGGDIQCIEVSAMTKIGLDDLENAILLQSEVMELKANPKRAAIGSVVESKLEQGKGSVATILVQKGTLKVGDIFVTGCETGRVRALINDKGRRVKEAIPGEPVEVLGLTGTPDAGDDFVVVDEDSKAREIAEFRARKRRAIAAAKNSRGSLEQLMSNIKAGLAEELSVIIKADVHGSVEAIASALNKLTENNDEVKVNVLHTGVGGITESDVTLANASNALIIGFNVRANVQARDLAKAEAVEVRYYSIIYNAIDDVKALLSGMLSPAISEKFIGYSQIREVFSISKYGKIAGCMVTDGIVKRGAKVRLLRDDIVIHEGVLKTLRRFKDEVKEVKEGFECGMAFENYEDIKEGDVIEAFEMQETARELEE